MVKKITTVTLNPCIDRTIEFEHFKFGGTHKVLTTRNHISGKGINTSIALHQLGEPTLCVGFNYMEQKNLVEKFLNSLGIVYDFVEVEGDIRTNIKIFEKETQTMTEFNEQGCEVDEEALEKLYAKVEEHLEHTSILVLNGSVPKGVPINVYSELIKRAKARGIKTVLDAANQLLLKGIQEKPYLIKPNRDEFEEAFGKKFISLEEGVYYAREIIRQGIPYVCISMGGEGAMLVSEDNAYLAPPLKLEIKGVQGAGDSLVAGMCIAINRGLQDEEILRSGAATASGSLIHGGTVLCNPEDFESMYKKTTIQKIVAVNRI